MRFFLLWIFSPRSYRQVSSSSIIEQGEVYSYYSFLFLLQIILSPPPAPLLPHFFLFTLYSTSLLLAYCGAVHSFFQLNFVWWYLEMVLYSYFKLAIFVTWFLFAVGTKFPVSQMEEQEVRAYREIEREDMHKLLQEYSMICEQAGVYFLLFSFSTCGFL